MKDIDYVRVYHYGSTCEGNTCSNHGCCDSNSFVCNCDSGWFGSSCEEWTGSFNNNFVSTNVQYTPATDVKVNGWGNDYCFYTDRNVEINYNLTLTITTSGCPGDCNGKEYSGAGWNSAMASSYGTYTFIAIGPSVVGTGFSMGAAQGEAEQISIILTGAKKNTVQISTWHSYYQFNQTTLHVNFDHSIKFHNYTFVHFPAYILFYIDNKLVKNATEVIPSSRLVMNAYYTVQPVWYGGPFVYNGPSTVIVSQASWSIASVTAKCPPPPPCLRSSAGTGTGLTGDYYDGDSGASYFTNYKSTNITTVNFTSWGQGPPMASVASDHFSIRWTGQVQSFYTSSHTFYTTSDDGVRLYVNGTLIIDKWIAQSPAEHSGTINLKGGVKYDIVLEYMEIDGGAVVSLSWSSGCHTKQIIPQSQLYPCGVSKNANGKGLTGRYYSDMTLGTLVKTQVDPSINFNWGEAGPTGQVDRFSIKWTGFVQPRYSGSYTFYVESDDGTLLYVNGQLLVDQWVDKGPSEYFGSISLVRGRNYSIELKYYENGGGAMVGLSWAHDCEPKQIIPQSQLFAS